MDDTTVDDDDGNPEVSDAARRAIAHVAHLLRPASPHAEIVYEQHRRGGLECEQTDPEVFFPGVSDPNRNQKRALAAAICGRCPVQAACLEWALDAGEEYGWWGGASFSLRARRRSQRIAEARDEAS